MTVAVKSRESWTSLEELEAQPTSAMSERELERGLGVRREHAHMERRRCVCGGWVVADAKDPFEGVEAHNQTIEHRDWRMAARWRR